MFLGNKRHTRDDFINIHVRLVKVAIEERASTDMHLGASGYNSKNLPWTCFNIVETKNMYFNTFPVTSLAPKMAL